MSYRRYLAWCLLAAGGVITVTLAWTAYRIRETGQAHRRARGGR